MKMKVLLLISLFILGCNSPNSKSSITKESKSSVITSRAEEVKYNLDKSLEKLSVSLKDIYKNSNNLNYQFMGSETSRAQSFITGKDLVIPILYETINSENILTIATLINLETSSKKLLIDNLIVDYEEFKNIIKKSNIWIEKTEKFENNLFLEKALDETIQVSFPQNTESQKYKAYMIFDGERKNRSLVLREETENPTQTVISFKQNKIVYLSTKLNDEYILGTLLENFDEMNKKMQDLNNAYVELNSLIEK